MYHFLTEEKHVGVVCDEPDSGSSEEEECHMAGLNMSSEML
jgi:hypothetical protein